MGEFAEYMQRLTHSQSQPYTHTASDLFFDSFLQPHFSPFPIPISNSTNHEFLNSPPILHNSDTNNPKLELQSTTTSIHISPSVSVTSTTIKTNNSGRGKKGKNKEKRMEKLADKVIHVRAKRGQATDSHSIAERVRREKINHKLRCLQDIVPGCHKSMGMAVMLEEIINYVHSLHNQVEFLSMELAAASSPYDFNLEKESSEKAQATAAGGAMETQKWLRERYEEELSSYQSTWSI